MRRYPANNTCSVVVRLFAHGLRRFRYMNVAAILKQLEQDSKKVAIFSKYFHFRIMSTHTNLHVGKTVSVLRSCRPIKTPPVEADQSHLFLPKTGPAFNCLRCVSNVKVVAINSNGHASAVDVRVVSDKHGMFTP